jgi:nucleoid DNA-binding protein
MKNVINYVAETFDLTKKIAGEIVDAVVGSIIKEIKETEKLRISGLGTFTVKQKAARKARNPKTGEAIDVPAKNVVAYKMSKDLKDTL